MSHKHKLKFWYISFIMCGVFVIVGLILYALKQNINLFYTPFELQQAKIPVGARVRVGGMVVANSLLSTDNLQVKFSITDYKHNLTVTYAGVLPDLFREGQGVVALGALNTDNVFAAEQILAKHDENYMPPELSKLNHE